jgi:N-methylhydantoinase B
MLKLFDRGVENKAIMDIIRLNVRVPDLVIGDIRAQLAAAHTGATRFLELIERYGAETIGRYTEAILDSTEAYVRNEILAMPDGTYEFTDYLDGDGFGSGPLAIVASLTITGDEIVVDFAGSAAQVPSALNATLSIVKAAVYTALMAVMDTSTGLACNAGFIRPIEVRAPAGSLLNARRPAARAARGVTAYRVVDAVLGALYQVVPGRVPAGGDGGVTVVTFGATDESGASAVLVDTPVAGWGGRPDKDGIDGISSLAANMANTPIEVMEADFPIRIEEYGFVPDTGGAGTYRGCVSVVRQYRFLAEQGVLQLRADRRDCLPYGLHGGDPGTRSDAILNPGPDAEQLSSKATRTIKRDDVVRIVVAGGGGYGDPDQRSLEAIQRDLESGLITHSHADAVYGVALAHQGEAR